MKGHAATIRTCPGRLHRHPPTSGHIRPSRRAPDGGAPWSAVVAALALALALGSPPAARGQAVRDPSLPWYTIETPHFAIHYHAPLGFLARRVAHVAERAHRLLVPLLGHAPSERTQVILTDESDRANGSATVLPRNTIRLFATAPADLSPLSDHDDWMRFLVTHEHTHVLHLDNWGGVASVVNAIFGKTYAPNVNSPRWLIEGFAIHEESAHTSGGRLRSSIFDMYMRMDALEGRVLRLDQISNAVDRWPHGNVWYLYGSFFVEFIADRYGREVLRDFAESYGESLLPYGLNRVALRTTGKTFVQLYDEFRGYLGELYGRQAARIRREGVEVGRRLTHHGEFVRSPRFLDDGHVAYWTNDGRDYPLVRLVDVETGAARELGRANGEAYLSPTRGGEGLVWSTTADHRNLYARDDLFLHDRATGRTRRLTRGARAREPDVSPDGRRVAYTVNGAGTTHLVVAALDDPVGSARVLLRNRRYDQVYTPRWSPDGRFIAVSRWLRGGYRDIQLIDAATGEVHPITVDRAFDTGPAWSPDGRWLFFSSDRTGVANLHAYDLRTGDVWQVTNVLSGAFSPDVSPDGRRITYLGYASRGYDVHVLDVDPTRWRGAAVYPDVRPPANAEVEVARVGSRRYRAVDTLAPQAWSLELGQDAFGTAIGVRTSGSDAADHHLYAAGVSVGLERGNVDADASWTIARSPAPVTVSGFHRERWRADLVVGGERVSWAERVFGGAASVAYPFLGQFHRNDVSVSYAVEHAMPADPVPLDLDPNAPPPALPATDLTRTTLGLSWSFSDAVRTTYDVTPSWGRRLGASVAWSEPALGSEYRALALRWAGVQYVEAPWAEHHVFALRYAGGVGWGDRAQRPFFAVGGFPDEDPLDQLLDGRFLGGVALRGYPQQVRVGTAYQLAQLEYRFVLWRPQFGIATLPVYLNRVYATAFVDAGDAYSGAFDPSRLLAGVGGELLVDFTIGYRLPYTLRLGVARGLMEGGETQWYLHLGVPF